MAPRRNVDRAAWETRYHRESMSRRVDRFERYDDGMDARFERYSDRGVDRYERGYDRYDRGVDRYDAGHGRHSVESELDRDFAAMKRVWQMIRAGAVRMLGEVGRQY